MSDDGTPPILRSLEIIYESRSSNEERKQATVYLEEAKNHPDAPSVGLALAQVRHRPAVARHYGLSLLEHCIRYKWDNYTDQQTVQIRTWTLGLAHDVTNEDPTFIRKKVAQLLEEIAEKSWGLTWFDFDQQLSNLWHGSLAHKELVLHSLETLSERVFGKDESAAGLRGAELGRFCVEVYTPLSALESAPIVVGNDLRLRYDSESWLERMVGLLEQYFVSERHIQTTLRECCMMSLTALRSCMSWLSLKGVRSTNCLQVLYNYLDLQDNQIQMVTLEVLHCLYHRVNFQREDIASLAQPLLSAEGISMLRKIYERLYCTVEELDDIKYMTLKRLTEVICSLGTIVEQNSWLLEEEANIDFNGLIELLVQTLRNPSLCVSIPIVYVWTKLLGVKKIRHSPQFTHVMSDLLGICNQRLIRFEMLPAESDDTTIQFLNEDIDTIPERHAFLGNYRRFCINILERIVRRSPFEALPYLLTQSSQLMRNLTEREGPDPAATFVTDSMQQLTVEAQCTVVLAAVKTYVRWLLATKDDPEIGRQRDTLQSAIEAWSVTMLENCTRDPIIQRRVLSLVIDLAVAALQQTSRIGISICERVLSSNLVSMTGSSPYEQAVKESQSSQPRELQKLAAAFADQLFPAYEEVRTSIERHLSGPNIEQRVRLDYQAFLLTIVQRSSVASPEERQARLRQMVDPLIQAWQEPALMATTTDLSSFRNLLGLDNYPSYFLSRKAYMIQDWSSAELDAEGIAMRDAIPLNVERLPLQATRSLLSVCAGPMKSERGGQEMYEVSEQLHALTPVILPLLLKLIGLAHAFNNPENWQDFAPEMRTIIARTVQDRVWQNGISSESRDAFFARVRSSRSSLEGLASATRGAVRTVRELSMWILHSLSDAGESFYGHLDLPRPLAHALYDDAVWLSPHQLSGLLSLSSTIIDKCPAKYRQHFLPPILVPLFRLLDRKTSSEWEALEQRNMTDGESLDQEMKTESVLRNLTYSAVMLVSHLLSHPAKGTVVPPEEEPSIRGLILTSPEILESLALFATHTLRMHDTRSCGIISRVLRGLLGEFQHSENSVSTTSSVVINADTAASVREFFSTEVLKACVTSIHEPYFVDLQKDLAALVASIIVLYASKTGSPRDVLLSLPNMTDEKVARHLEEIVKAPSERAQRVVVLSLLDGVRGVSIHEQGKLEKPLKKSRTAMEQKYMSADGAAGNGVDRNNGVNNTHDGNGRRNSPELGGLDELFG